MANITNAFYPENGINLDDLVGIFASDTDPSTTGFDAPVGSIIICTNGVVYQKTAAGITAWTTIPQGLNGVRVDDSDTTLGHLTDKLVVGSALTKTVQNVGGNETLSVDLNTSGVVPGTYTSAEVTVDALGRITTATSSPLPTDQFYPTGFMNRTDNAYTFDSGTRTFTLAPVATSFSVYVGGKKYLKTAAESVVLPAPAGTYLIYLDKDTRALAYREVSPGEELAFANGVETPVAAVLWDGAAGLTFDTRYGISMAWATRQHVIDTRGYEHVSGLKIIDTVPEYVSDGSVDWHAQIGLSNGVLRNADITANIVHAAAPSAQWQQVLAAPAQLPVFAMTGTGASISDLKLVSLSTFPVIPGVERIKYNYFDGTTWSLVEAPEGAYICMFVYSALADTSPVTCAPGTRYDMVQQQSLTNNDWTAWREQILPGLKNVRPLWKLIFQTSTTYANTVKARLVDYIDLRSLAITAPSDHSALSGLEEDDHPQYVHTGTSRTITAQHTFAPAAVQAPFIIGANAAAQTVVGLSADHLGGVPASNFQQIDVDLSALANISTTGVYIRTGAGTSATRSITGTADQITVANGDGISGNPTLSIAANPIFSGTGAITLSSGTTADRPAPVNGMLRHNLTIGALETPISGVWKSVVLSDDKRLSEPFTAVVSKDPALGEFSSIAAAVNSVVFADPNDQWVVRVGPGTYTEPEIIVPGNVHIASAGGQYSVVVTPDNTVHPVFTMMDAATVSFLTVSNVTGAAQVAFKLHNTVGTVGFGVLLHKVSLDNVTTAWDVDASTADTIVYLEYCDATLSGGLAGLNASSSNGFSAYINAENFYIYGDTTNPGTGVNLTGVGTYCNMQAYGFEGVGAGTLVGHAIEMGDGARLDAKGGSIFGWHVGVHLNNIGAPAETNLLATALHTNTLYDLWAEHPGSKGVLQGTANTSQVNAGAAADFTLAYSDPITNTYVQTGDFWLGTTPAALTNVGDLIIETPALGVLNGGIITAGTGLNAVVSAGAGYLHNGGDAIRRIEWSDSTLAVPGTTTTYIYVDHNGVVQSALSEPDGATNINLGFVFTNATEVSTLGNRSVIMRHHGNLLDTMLRETATVVFAFGSLVSENVSTPRAIDVTAGRWYWGTQVRNPSAKTAPAIIDIYHVAGVPTYTPIAIVPNDTYDNGIDLVSLLPNKFTKHLLCQINEGIYQKYYLVHGNAEYGTLVDARNGPLPILPAALTGAPVIAAIIVESTVNSIAEIIDVRPMFLRTSGGTVVTGGSGVTVHANLSGLLADDHPQYFRVDGTRAMAGALNLGTNNLTNVGTINGINLAAHGARHAPNTGADPLPTAAAVSISAVSTNTEGIANTFARSDHTHAMSGVQALDADLTALAAFTGTGIPARTAADTWMLRTITGTAGQITLADGAGVAGNPTISLATAGTVGTYTTVTTDAYGRVTSGTTTQAWNTISSTPTTLSGYGILDAQPLDADLSALASTVTTGLYTVTGAGTAVTRAITAPVAGITITNGNGVLGNPTLVLANDLGALEGLASTGLAVRFGADQWVTRAIAGTANQITVASGDGVAGAPSISITSNPVIPGTDAMIVPSGTSSQEVNVTNGALRYSTSTSTMRMRQTGAWMNIGTVTSVDVLAPVAGLTATGAPITSSGTITLALADDLGALEGLTSTGLAVRTGVSTWANTAIAAGSTKISVANGNGVLGSPTIDVAEANLVLSNMGGTLGATHGGTGLTTLGTANQILGVDAAGATAEYKTITAGAGITVTHTANDIAFAAVGAKILQVVTGVIPQTTGTTQIPWDNTAPLITEGFQIWSTSFTPVSATSKIIVIFSTVIATSGVGGRVFSSVLWYGNTLVGVSANNGANAGQPYNLTMQQSHTPGSAATVTIQSRVGTNGSGTTYVNQTATATMGGFTASDFIIIEVAQ